MPWPVSPRSTLARRPDVLAMIEARFEGFGRTMPVVNARQADIPEGGVVMPPVGTAAGFSLEVGATTLHVLPGVPWELRRMFDEHVAPAVLARSGGRVLVTRVVHLAGMGESDVATALADVEDAAERRRRGRRLPRHGSGHPGQAVGLGHGRGRRWRQPLPSHVDRVVAELGAAVVGIDGDGLEVGVVSALRSAGLTIATAESATGGQVAARLTQVPGASQVVRGGVVVYATDTKVSLAGIDQALLAAHPPVSEEVTRALAVAVRTRLGADIGVATTASAGPTAQDGVPVGTAVWAVADASGARAWSRRLPGDRDDVRDRLSTAAIDAVRRHLLTRSDTSPD